MLEIQKDDILKAKIFGEEFNLKKIVIGNSMRYRELSKSIDGDATRSLDILVEILKEAGLREEVAKQLTLEQATSIIEALSGQKKS